MLRRVATNFLAQFASILLSFLDRFLVVGVLLRSWGTATYADWAVLAAATGLLASFELGLNVYTGNALQQAFASGSEERFQRTLQIATGLSLVVGTVLLTGAILFCAVTNLETALSIKHLSNADAVPIFLLLAIAVIARVMRGSISQVYRGRGAFAAGTMVDQAAVASTVLTTLISVTLGAPPLALAAIYVAIDLIAGWGFMLADQRRRFPGLSYRPVLAHRAEVRQIIGSVRWLAIVQGMPVAWQTVPVLALGHLAETGQIVSFVLIRTLVNLARQIGSMLSISAGVEMSAALYAGRNGEVVRGLNAVGALLSGATASLTVLILGYGDAFVHMWSGGRASFDAPIAIPLLLATIVATPATPVASLLMLGHGPRLLALAQLAQFCIGVGLCVALAPWLGAQGAAAGLAAGEIAAFGGLLPLLAAAVIGLDLRGYYTACLLASVRSALLTGAVVMLARLGLPQDTPALMGLSAMLSGLLGFLPSVVLSLPASQRARLADFVTAQWSRAFANPK